MRLVGLLMLNKLFLDILGFVDVFFFGKPHILEGLEVSELPVSLLF